jgi:hypothetical protein
MLLLVLRHVDPDHGAFIIEQEHWTPFCIRCQEGVDRGDTAIIEPN